MTQDAVRDFARRLEQLLPQVMRGFVRRHHCFAYKDKVTLSQMFILEYLQEHSPSRMTELANFMKVS
ncbi:MAG: hypothetical protein WC432_02745, partial [Candidatus Omnitrophota bacterium]